MGRGEMPAGVAVKAFRRLRARHRARLPKLREKCFVGFARQEPRTGFILFRRGGRPEGAGSASPPSSPGKRREN